MAMLAGDIYLSADGVQVEVLAGQAGCSLACCGQPMQKLEAKTADAAREKHVPVVTAIPGGYKVTVGSVPHPMVDDHWIQWVELRLANKVYRAQLNPGEAPEATFLIAEKGAPTAREYCNKHGLWQA